MGKPYVRKQVRGEKGGSYNEYTCNKCLEKFRTKLEYKKHECKKSDN